MDGNSVTDDKRIPKTKEKLLESALVLIAESGVSNLSVSDLVKHSGVTRPTFYSYFEDTQGILEELWFQFGSWWLETLSSPESEVEALQNNSRVVALAEIFLLAHRNAPIREFAKRTLENWVAAKGEGVEGCTHRLWFLASRLGYIMTVRVWRPIEQTLLLERYLKAIDPKVSGLVRNDATDLPEIELNDHPVFSVEMMQAAIRIVSSNGVAGLTFLRLGRVLEVTPGYLASRVPDLSELVAGAYDSAQTSAAEQNLQIWKDLRLGPEGFARFITGSVGASRQNWRWFRTEVMLEAAHNPELAIRVSDSMNTMTSLLKNRTKLLGFATPLAETVAKLVHTLLFGFSALAAAGIDIRKLDHKGIIRNLLGQVGANLFTRK